MNDGRRRAQRSNLERDPRGEEDHVGRFRDPRGTTSPKAIRPVAHAVFIDGRKGKRYLRERKVREGERERGREGEKERGKEGEREGGREGGGMSKEKCV